MATTHEIPGGEVTFCEQDEMSVAAQRRIALASRKLKKEALTATSITHNGAEDEKSRETDLAGLPVDLDDDQLEATWAWSDALLLGLLKSWTLDRPLPRERAELEELPAPLYAELSKIVGKLQRKDADKPDGFTVDAIEDRDAPTGA